MASSCRAVLGDGIHLWWFLSTNDYSIETPFCTGWSQGRRPRTPSGQGKIFQFRLDPAYECLLTNWSIFHWLVPELWP